jgi:hypothetical protein
MIAKILFCPSGGLGKGRIHEEYGCFALQLCHGLGHGRDDHVGNMLEKECLIDLSLSDFRKRGVAGVELQQEIG